MAYFSTTLPELEGDHRQTRIWSATAPGDRLDWPADSGLKQCSKQASVVLGAVLLGAVLRQLPMETISRHFTGIALELLPTSQFEPASAPPKVRAVSLLGRIGGVKRSMAQLLGLALVMEIFDMISPLFLSWVVDHAIVSADRDLLVTLALGFLLLLQQTATSAMRAWMVMGLNASLKVQSRANLFSHLLNRPETIRASARVVSLANGAIVDDGPPARAMRLI